MKRRIFPVTALALTLAAGLSATSAFAQTKWDLAAAYPATNFHTENMVQLAGDVDKATGGKLKITVHANAALFKAPEIKRAVRDVVQHHHIERRQVLEARRRHAVHHPAVKRIARHDEAKLELAHLCALRRHQVCRRNNGAGFGLRLGLGFRFHGKFRPVGSAIGTGYA